MRGSGLDWSTLLAPRGLGAAAGAAEGGADPGWPGAPLSASAWPPAPPPSPRADLVLRGPGPRPAQLPAPPWAACAQPGSPSPGQDCTRSWAAEAGAKARGCFFTRSLKYFGKPQSGAARKWPLACSRQASGEERGLRLAGGRVTSPQISEVCQPKQVSPSLSPTGTDSVWVKDVTWTPRDSECAPQKSQTSNK